MQFHFAVFERVEELDLVGPWEMVGILAARGHCLPPKLTSLNSMEPTGEHGMRFLADFHFERAPIPDVLVVPGGSGAREAMRNPSVLNYLRRCGAECTNVLSVCTGSYLMQAAGLFNGRKAVTHWAFLDHLREDPSITVEEERVVRDGSVWSAAGVSSGMDMMLAFIAHVWDDSVAADVQLEAEYYPSGVVYGAPSQQPNISRYIRELDTKPR
ncbi:MAG: DJ-1/PfpI family protein [Pseudomonadota bacterium]|nr:DJ-1/PfpI family protein [Pseudomonadota bacterium]